MNCAASFTSSCDECGTELPASARFCPQCAHPVSTPAPGASGPAVLPRDPRSYTPQHLAERILRSRSALEGERKQVTVLFADIRNSMELASQVGAEDWHAILDRFFQLLADGVHRFEGTINQYTGDGIMALFGAPIAHEDHVQRACYTALHLCESVAEFAQELRREHGLDFQMRIGLNSGDVVVGRIGDDLRMDYTAQGETVGLAQRMETLAETGRPYLTASTASLAEGWFELADLGEFKVKGVQTPMHVFALDGVGSVHTRLDLSRARGFSRFVGRADDLATLEAALEQTLEGHGQVVGLVADAGVGKSRICLEFTDRCRARGITVREAQGISHGKNIPLLPVLQLLRSVFGIDARDSDAEARQKIAGAVVLRDESLQADLPLLFDYLGVTDPKRPAPALEPGERQHRVQGLLQQLLHARGREEPGVFLIEDLHWIDEASERFLEQMIDAIPGTQSLVLVNFRPEYEVPWGGRSYYRQLPLLPLGPEAMRDLLVHLLGTNSSLGDLPQRIQQRAAGNPFFIEEMVQSLADAGNLAGERGSYELVTSVDEIALPERVETLLAARIDRIDEREKRVLQSAAVIGTEFSRGVLNRICELDAAELDAALRGLKGAEFIHERQIYPEVEYGFKHPLTQDVAYHSQLGENRRKTHAAVAGAIEETATVPVDESAALLAHHYEEAGENLPAARWHRVAAERAGMMQVGEVYRHWGRVRELTDELPDNAEAEQLGTLSRVQMFLVGARLARPEEEIEALFHECKAIVKRTGSDLGHIQILSSYGLYRLYATGNALEARKVLPEAVALADGLGEVSERLAARFVACTLYLVCDVGRAIETADEALDLQRAEPAAPNERLLGGFHPESAFVFMRTTALLLAGRLAEARAAQTQFRRLADKRPETKGYVFTTAAFIALRMGDLAEAERLGVQCIEFGEATGNSSPLVTGLGTLGESLLRQGRAREALAPLERALAIHREQGVFRQIESIAAADLAEAWLELGELERADQVTREALAFAQANGLKTGEANLQGRVAANALARNGAAGAAEAERALSRSHELIEESGFHSALAMLHERRAELAAAKGDTAERDRQLQLALEAYEGRGATGHIERLKNTDLR